MAMNRRERARGKPVPAGVRSFSCIKNARFPENRKTGCSSSGGEETVDLSSQGQQEGPDAMGGKIVSAR